MKKKTLVQLRHIADRIQNNAPVILPPFFTPSVRSGNLLF